MTMVLYGRGPYFKFRGTNEIGSEGFCIQEKFWGLQSYVIPNDPVYKIHIQHLGQEKKHVLMSSTDPSTQFKKKKKLGSVRHPILFRLMCLSKKVKILFQRTILKR